MRIALFQLGHESNTFVPGVSEIPDLGAGDWIRAKDVAGIFTGTHTAVGGILDALKEFGAEPVPMDMISRGGAFNAGPAMSRVCIEESIAHICRCLSQAEYDGICAVIHGAGCGEGYDDADGYWLERVRQVAGERPVFAALDLHGNITQRMVENADGLFGIKTLPHTDFYEAGYRAAACMCRALRGEIKPQMAFCPIPMILSSAFSATIEGVGKEIKESIEDFGQANGLLDISYFHSFAAADTPATSASIVAIADGYRPDREAEQMAQLVWSRRAEYLQPTLSAAEAVEEALKLVRDGYVVINDGNDNPGGGNPGDGTWLLQELLARDLPGTIMGPFFDPQAAAVCHTHAVGDRFTLEIGGHTDPTYGPTLTVEAKLLSLCDGCFTCVSPMYAGSKMTYGPTARVSVGNVEVILVTRRFQTYDDRPYLMTGARMEDYRMVALKSQNHFRAYFRPVADAIVSVHTPSTFPADIRELDYQKVQRPIYPLDEDVRFDGNWKK